MANHPINLALRFALELVGLFALAYWGWTQHSGVVRFLLAVGTPLLAAMLWATFRVPNDPGRAPVPTPGWARLLLELIYFGAAVWALSAAGQPTWALVLGVVTALHYLASYDRVARLLRSGASRAGV